MEIRSQLQHCRVSSNPLAVTVVEFLCITFEFQANCLMATIKCSASYCFVLCCIVITHNLFFFFLEIVIIISSARRSLLMWLTKPLVLMLDFLATAKEVLVTCYLAVDDNAASQRIHRDTG